MTGRARTPRREAGRAEHDPPPPAPPEWWVYVLLAAGARPRTYVGITTDPERRLAQHNGETPGGAKATRSGRPWRLGVVFGPFPARGPALRAELRVKRLRGLRRLTAPWPRRERPAGFP